VNQINNNCWALTGVASSTAGAEGTAVLDDELPLSVSVTAQTPSKTATALAKFSGVTAKADAAAGPTVDWDVEELDVHAFLRDQAVAAKTKKRALGDAHKPGAKRGQWPSSAMGPQSKRKREAEAAEAKKEASEESDGGSGSRSSSSDSASGE
jgi:hypothetical protein